MSNTAALLGNLIDVEATINYYTQQQIFWTKKYEANHELLAKQEGYYSKYEDAESKALNNSSELKATHGRTVTVGKDNTNEALATDYASVKVWQYDADLSQELVGLDIEYDTMKTMYDTMLEELRAQLDADKTATSTAAQDTGLLQS